MFLGYNIKIMRKCLAIFAVTALMAVSVSSQPNKTSDHKYQSANQSQSSIVFAAPEKQDCATTDQAQANSYPPKWYAPLERPEWWLVLVGFVTCGVIGWQSFETRRAATATRESVAVLEKSVAAARAGADAAASQIQLVKDKERARVRIEFKRLDLSFNPQPGGYKVKFKVFLDGATEAYILETHCIAEIYDPASTNYDIGGGMGLPQVITPAERVIEQRVALFTESCGCPPEVCDPNEERVQLAREGELPVVVNGFIRYKDLFGGKWRVRFNLRWQYYRDFPTLKINLSGGAWESSGPNGEYEETDEQNPN
jgi:hypothetical protein